MSEIALISARKSRLESSAKKGIKVLKWRSIWLIRKQIRRVQIGITLIGILTGI
jgi:putative hemolysin